MKPLSDLLKELVIFDQKLTSIRDTIAKLKQDIDENNRILPELGQEIEDIKQSVLEAQKSVDLQELNAKSLRESEKTKRAALDNVKNQKEYAAAEKSLQSVLQRLFEQEDVLVKAWHTLDQAKQGENTKIVALEEKIIKIKEEIDKNKAAIDVETVEFEKISQEKDKQASTVPADWLSKYESMRKRVSNPIVPMINGSCSACYYAIPPQDVNRLKRNALLLCRSCYRLLYFNKEEEKDLKSDSY